MAYFFLHIQAPMQEVPRPLQLNLMFLGPNWPLKYPNVKILFSFQAYVLVTWVMEMAATWVASIKNVVSVIFIYVCIYICCN